METAYCGVDFGTTNSTVGLCRPGAAPELVVLEGEHRTIPTALFYSLEDGRTYFGRSAVIRHNAGELTVANMAPASLRAQSEAEAKESRLGITGVMVDAFNIIQDRISRARLAGDPPDLALLPRLGDIGLSEFHRAGEAIERGYEEARAKLGELKRMQETFIR